MNRVVVITGGTSGIGKACEGIFEYQKDKVYVLGRTEIDNKNYIKCDVTSEESVNNAFEKIFNTEKKIDILINSAGYGVSGAIELVEQGEAKKLFEVNFFGIINCYKAALKYMEKGGKILNISSVCGLFALPFRGLYCASKSAVNMISYSMAMECRDSGIKICAICPGDTKTNFTKNRVKVFTTNNRYKDKIANAATHIDNKEESRMSAESVARKIFNVANKKHLKPMVIIGTKYKFLYFASRIFPLKWLNGVTGKKFGGYKK